MAEDISTVPCPKCGTPCGSAAMSGGSAVCPGCGETFDLSAHHPASSITSAEQQIAQLAVRLKLLTEEQVSQVAHLVAPPSAQPGARFVAAGLLTEAQIAQLITTLRFKHKRVEDNRFGALAIERHWARPEQVAAALAEQKRIFMQEGHTRLMGELLVEAKVLSQEQCDTLLAVQGRARASTAEKQSPPARLRLVIPHDRMTASVVVDEGRPSLEQLHALLAKKGVNFGVDEAQLKAIAAGTVSASQPVVVATGRAPQLPKHGSIEYLFELHPQRAAREHGDGLIDYRDHGDIPQVSVGTELARRIAATPGEPGMDVFGRAIPAPPAKDATLKVGKGAEVDADKSTARAVFDGHPALSPTGVISVYPEFRVQGDVDNSTGHVNFHGRVIVTGTVRSTFRVRCGELIAQEIEAADVQTEGDITVNGGIIGTHIRSGGSLRARYIHQAHAEVLGDVIVAREVVDSEIVASGAFASPQCTLLASRVSAMKGVEAHEIGSETSTPCRIVVGVDEHVQRELTRQQAEIEAQRAACDEIAARIAAAGTRQEALTAEIGPLAQEQDRAMVHLRQSGATPSATEMEQLLGLETRLDGLLAEQDRLQAQVAVDQTALDQASEALRASDEALVELKQWAAERTGEFHVRADMVHQQTMLKGPHLEARLNTDCKSAELVEREREENGHSSWHFTRK